MVLSDVTIANANRHVPRVFVSGMKITISIGRTRGVKSRTLGDLLRLGRAPRQTRFTLPSRQRECALRPLLLVFGSADGWNSSSGHATPTTHTLHSAAIGQRTISGGGDSGQAAIGTGSGSLTEDGDEEADPGAVADYDGGGNAWMLGRLIQGPVEPVPTRADSSSLRRRENLHQKR